jgi:hypothetical protein
MDDFDEVLRRALRYPYATPGRSFVLAGGRALDPATAPLDLAGREPLLAYGANAAPEALARKLGAEGEPLLAERTTLVGHDVVYSAHLSPYGAVPATLTPSAGTEIAAFVLHLTGDQRRALDATELNYEASEVEGVAVYLSRHGPLTLDGSPVALAAVPASGRLLPAMSEAQVLDRVRRLLSPRLSLEQFVATAADPATARCLTELLKRSRSGAG